MSQLFVSEFRGIQNNTITCPSGQLLAVEGNLKVPAWTTANRPASPQIGFIGYNTTDSVFEIYTGATNGWAGAGAGAAPDGSTAAKAVVNGVSLKAAFPSKPSGLYFVKSASMSVALQMYVDMVEDGGGYDFYTINNGNSPSYITDGFTGSSTGLELWEARSPACYVAASKAVATFDNGNFGSYWSGCGHVYKPNGGGNYTGCIMRSSYYGGNNCNDWRVKSGQRWWLRNSTFSEPNGDYNGNGFLQMYGNQVGNPYGGNDMGFNDGGAYNIGSRYILSTNAKV